MRCIPTPSVSAFPENLTISSWTARGLGFRALRSIAIHTYAEAGLWSYGTERFVEADYAMLNALGCLHQGDILAVLGPGEPVQPTACLFCEPLMYEIPKHRRTGRHAQDHEVAGGPSREEDQVPVLSVS